MTGTRPGASTSSNVFISLFGEDGNSEPRELCDLTSEPQLQKQQRRQNSAAFAQEAKKRSALCCSSWWPWSSKLKQEKVLHFQRGHVDSFLMVLSKYGLF